MLILGTKPGQHDASFALVRDGRPIFVYEQERSNRVKHGMSIDLSVLFEALQEHSVRPEQIDFVTNCIDPALLPERLNQLRTFLRPDVYDRAEAHLMWRLPTWRQILLNAGFPPHRVIDVRHHLCHCAGAYYVSPFSDAAIISVDGSGETETAMIAHGIGGDIRVLRTTQHPASLGHIYQAATFWLGWEFGEEGKTMALAAYGSPRYYDILTNELVNIDATGQFSFKELDNERSCLYTSRELVGRFFEPRFGKSRDASSPIAGVHKDIAASVQKVCDEIMLRSAWYARSETKAANLLITGGVGLNSVSNGLILRRKLFRKVVAYPQCHDAGTALGGALFVYHRGRKGRRPRVWQMDHAYWGKNVDVENIVSVATKYDLAFRRDSDIAASAADLLAAGRIVGWVQGRAEIGPRALGNRSILANPLISGIKDRINVAVKHRERWRPFAPSILREDLDTYFEAEQDLPYMVVVAQTKAQWRDRLSAVTHVDGGARVQTVTKESNPLFYRLISEFKARTGLPLLLNTSFNDRGEPLVQTAEQAIELYLRSDMDALVISNYLFESKPTVRDIAPFSTLRTNVAKLPNARMLCVVAGACTNLDGTMSCISAARPEVEFLLDRLQTVPSESSGKLPANSRLDLELVSRYGALVVIVGNHSADEFVFDSQVYNSELASFSRKVTEELRLPVYWIDRCGDVVAMKDVLYIKDRQVQRHRAIL